MHCNNRFLDLNGSKSTVRWYVVVKIQNGQKSTKDYRVRSIIHTLGDIEIFNKLFDRRLLFSTVFHADLEIQMLDGTFFFFAI